MEAMTYPDFDLLLPVVAFDFDGVIAENTWPASHIGAANEEAFDAIEHYFNLDCEVVIFTARPSAHFPRIWKWLEENNMDHAIYDVTNRKPRACLYFDDRAVRWPLCG
jgi:hypothetical protein